MDQEDLESPEPLDFTIVGYNIRVTRLLSNLTQLQLAERASVDRTTICRLESGKPTHISNLRKICDGLDRTLDFMAKNRYESNSEVYVNRKQDRNWIALIELRKNPPPDSAEQMQDEQERLRLGRVGLVPIFHALTFSMPQGPGATFAEIFKTIEFKPSLTYKDCIIYCVRGQIRVTVGGQSYELSEGDVIGYPSRLGAIHEPLHEVGPNDLPPVTLYVGANRIGRLPSTQNKARARSRKK